MISVVMTYFNRRQQLINTLTSIQRSAQTDFEVILVDDCSDQRVDGLSRIFPFLKVIRLEKSDKWYVNTCIPFNIGIAQARGDIIVLQNAECLHVQDILTYVVNNLTDFNFLSISCYAPDEKRSKEINSIKPEKLESWVAKLPQQEYWKIGWYNHPVYRPVYFHFCAALTRKNMDFLGGFDERYSMGIAHDDNELINRIDRLGLRKEIPTEVMVIHQWHKKVNRFSDVEYFNDHKRNKMLYNILTLNEDSIYKRNSYAG